MVSPTSAASTRTTCGSCDNSESHLSRPPCDGSILRIDPSASKLAHSRAASIPRERLMVTRFCPRAVWLLILWLFAAAAVYGGDEAGHPGAPSPTLNRVFAAWN